MNKKIAVAGTGYVGLSLAVLLAQHNQVTAAELLVRVNPIHEKTENYISSEEEINRAIENGAKILMLGEKETKRNCYFIGSGEPRQLKDYLLEIGQLCGKEDLIKIGLRTDDGIKYTLDMFDTTPLKEDIGEYITKHFTDGIKYTLENY